MDDRHLSLELAIAEFFANLSEHKQAIDQMKMQIMLTYPKVATPVTIYAWRLKWKFYTYRLLRKRIDRSTYPLDFLIATKAQSELGMV
jgi:hypothetical protein